MSCASETYATIVGPRTSLCLIEQTGGAKEPVPRVTKTAGEIRPAKSPRRDRPARVVPDDTNSDPEHIWGDEGPVNE